jgi:hypothetical protein
MEEKKKRGYDFSAQFEEESREEREMASRTIINVRLNLVRRVRQTVEGCFTEGSKQQKMSSR